MIRPESLFDQKCGCVQWRFALVEIEAACRQVILKSELRFFMSRSLVQGGSLLSGSLPLSLVAPHVALTSLLPLVTLDKIGFR